MSDERGRETRVSGNPNPHGTCFCGKDIHDCPGGAGYVSPNEIEGQPYYEVANYISDACVLRLGRGVGGETNGVGAAEGAVQARYTGPEADPETGAWLAPWTPGNRPSYYDDPTTLRNEGDVPSAELIGARGDYDPNAIVLPEQPVNPVADSLEEATRLLEEQDLARLEDNGGPVI